MKKRQLGNSGLKVSAIGFGWKEIEAASAQIDVIGTRYTEVMEKSMGL